LKRVKKKREQVGRLYGSGKRRRESNFDRRLIRIKGVRWPWGEKDKVRKTMKKEQRWALGRDVCLQCPQSWLGLLVWGLGKVGRKGIEETEF